MPLRVVGVVATAELARLQIATQLDTLEEVLRWAGDVVEVVVQDEYNHDVVLRAPTGGELFLVFDTT